MKKNTRLLAVLLALGLLALSLTACAASSKYVAETTAAVSNSAAYDSAPHGGARLDDAGNRRVRGNEIRKWRTLHDDRGHAG